MTVVAIASRFHSPFDPHLMLPRSKLPSRMDVMPLGGWKRGVTEDDVEDICFGRHHLGDGGGG
ncbi:MAG: hypothetical protein JSR21_20595 [Proteobacteria bacterium]|nr:hypothetical protein [Pseudomonadota bacterium]